MLKEDSRFFIKLVNLYRIRKLEALGFRVSALVFVLVCAVPFST